MPSQSPRRENWFRVLRHDNGDITWLEMTDESGVPFALGPIDALTECIPFECRPLGSRFLMEWGAPQINESDGAEDLRVRVRDTFHFVRPA